MNARWTSGVGSLALQQLPHRASIADVAAHVLRLRPRDVGRADVEDDDPLGLVALDQELGEAAADVSRAAGDHVAHVRILFGSASA